MSTETIEAMRQFAESYSKRTNTYFCSDRTVTAYVLEGLAKNKIELGSPLCPCRYYDDKCEEASSSYWNCPCLPMRERKECHCMLFLPENNEYSSKSQELSLEELKTLLSSQSL
jgi:ferredoxin-thioredoxin reductase catalytic chain